MSQITPPGLLGRGRGLRPSHRSAALSSCDSERRTLPGASPLRACQRGTGHSRCLGQLGASGPLPRPTSHRLFLLADTAAAGEATVICPWTMQRMWPCLVGAFEGGGTFVYLCPQLLPLGSVAACVRPSHPIVLPVITATRPGRGGGAELGVLRACVPCAGRGIQTMRSACRYPRSRRPASPRPFIFPLPPLGSKFLTLSRHTETPLKKIEEGGEIP